MVDTHSAGMPEPTSGQGRVMTAAWTAYLRQRKEAVDALVESTTSILASLRSQRGGENGVITEKVMLGENIVLFEITGTNFLVTSPLEALSQPFFAPLMQLLELNGEDLPAVDDKIAGSIGNFSYIANPLKLLKLLDAALQMIADLNHASEISIDGYHYAVKLGDAVLIEIVGTDYTVTEHFGAVLSGLKEKIMKLVMIVGKGSNIEKFELVDGSDQATASAAA